MTLIVLFRYLLTIILVESWDHFLDLLGIYARVLLLHTVIVILSPLILLFFLGCWIHSIYSELEVPFNPQPT